MKFKRQNGGSGRTSYSGERGVFKDILLVSYCVFVP